MSSPSVRRAQAALRRAIAPAAAIVGVIAHETGHIAGGHLANARPPGKI
ncbi:MAG: hypothetical protein ACJ8DN_09025 [Microvirga sp.]